MICFLEYKKRTLSWKLRIPVLITDVDGGVTHVKKLMTSEVTEQC